MMTNQEYSKSGFEASLRLQRVIEGSDHLLELQSSCACAADGTQGDGSPERRVDVPDSGYLRHTDQRSSEGKTLPRRKEFFSEYGLMLSPPSEKN